MLDEWRPLLCPFDITVINGLQYLGLFLPSNPAVEEMDTGFRYNEIIYNKARRACIYITKKNIAFSEGKNLKVTVKFGKNCTFFEEIL